MIAIETLHLRPASASRQGWKMCQVGFRRHRCHGGGNVHVDKLCLDMGVKHGAQVPGRSVGFTHVVILPCADASSRTPEKRATEAEFYRFPIQALLTASFESLTTLSPRVPTYREAGSTKRSGRLRLRRSSPPTEPSHSAAEKIRGAGALFPSLHSSPVRFERAAREMARRLPPFVPTLQDRPENLETQGLVGGGDRIRTIGSDAHSASILADCTEHAGDLVALRRHCDQPHPTSIG